MVEVCSGSRVSQHRHSYAVSTHFTSEECCMDTCMHLVRHRLDTVERHHQIYCDRAVLTCLLAAKNRQPEVFHDEHIGAMDMYDARCGDGRAYLVKSLLERDLILGTCRLQRRSHLRCTRLDHLAYRACLVLPLWRASATGA